MKYIASVLNSRMQFLRLASINENQLDEKGAQKIDRFLFRVTCLISHLETLHNAEKQTVLIARNYFNQLTWPANKRIAVNGQTVLAAYTQIAPALSAIVDIQNQLLEIAKLLLGVSASTKSSLKDALKTDLIHLGFPAEFVVLLEEYWKESGEYVRYLRDVSEHFDDLTGEAILEWVTDPGQLLILLPDNPETKQPKKFTFEQNIDAFHVLRRELLAFEYIIEQVGKLAGCERGEFQQGFSVGLEGDLAGREARTIVLNLDIKGQNKNEIGELVFEVNALELSQEDATNSSAAKVSVRMLKPDGESSKETN